jgi:hypothetical protein
VSVYFITCREAKAVKIGHSVDPYGRLPEIQLGCPLPLKVEAIVAGGASEEKRYHGWFAAERIHGEWFRLTEMIETIIKLNPAPAPRPSYLKANPHKRSSKPRNSKRWELKGEQQKYEEMIAETRAGEERRLLEELDRLSSVEVAA